MKIILFDGDRELYTNQINKMMILNNKKKLTVYSEAERCKRMFKRFYDSRK